MAALLKGNHYCKGDSLLIYNNTLRSFIRVISLKGLVTIDNSLYQHYVRKFSTISEACDTKFHTLLQTIHCHYSKIICITFVLEPAAKI
jgi:hypothetical protein